MSVFSHLKVLALEMNSSNEYLIIPYILKFLKRKIYKTSSNCFVAYIIEKYYPLLLDPDKTKTLKIILLLFLKNKKYLITKLAS